VQASAPSPELIANYKMPETLASVQKHQIIGTLTVSSSRQRLTDTSMPSLYD
jgi:hypothetical protein